MKKKHACLFLYLFCSSILFGQIDNKNNNCNHQQISIDKIVWDADLRALENVMWAYPNPPQPISQIIPDLSPFNALSFHIVVLKFGTNGPETEADFRFDASLYSTRFKEKPIYFVYPKVQGLTVSRRDLHTVRFHKTPANIWSKIDNDNGNGVATTIGIMGRSGSITGKIGSTPGGGIGSNVSDFCMDLEINNLITDNCASSEPTYSTKCASVGASFKVETDGVSINSYPNPVHNHLFIETGGLGVRNVNLLNLQGQSQRVDVIHGESIWQINTSKLESGLYILQVETDTGSSVKKIYVQ